MSESSGAPLWGADKQVSTNIGAQQNACIVGDSLSGAIVVWEDYTTGAANIYAQHLDAATGAQLWTPSGIPVCTAAGDQLIPRAVMDGYGGVIIAWNDSRAASGAVYAKRLDSAGSTVWGGVDGLAVSTLSSLANTDPAELTWDGSGGAIVAWPDYRSGSDIYAQHVKGDGTPDWTADGLPVCASAAEQMRPQIIFSTMAGAIISWEDTRNGGRDIYAQRLDTDGAAYWGVDGAPVCVNERNKRFTRICGDAQNGALLSWQENWPSGDIRAQRIDVNGVTRWASEGVPVCGGTWPKNLPVIANDYLGGAVVAWTDYRNSTSSIYVQKLDAAGNPCDTQNGMLVSDPLLNTLMDPALCTDGVGGGILSWIRASDRHVMGQRIDWSYRYYLAEGNTLPGFSEFICLGNPYVFDVPVTINYFAGDGTVLPEQNLTIPAQSRTTVSVLSATEPGKEISAIITSGNAIICERPMYFNYGNILTGGHDVVAATAPAYTWYFAEGATLPGFDEYICVMNPSTVDAFLTFRFQDQLSGEIMASGTVTAGRRATFRVVDLIGIGHEASLKVESSQPVVAERPMYFNYSGMGGAYSWSGGHCVMGTTYLAREYLFAEGTTRFAEGSTFDEWLTLQNPNATDITVDAFYQLAGGAPVTRHYAVPANHRVTVYVPNEVGFEQDVSVRLACATADFLAERPMYFDYRGWGMDWTGGHCVIGGWAPGSAWYFAEGATFNDTNGDFHEYLCLQNPDAAQDAQVTIRYYPQGAASFTGAPVTVPANSRRTIFVNSDAGAGLQLSCGVEVTSGPGIVVERPMYFAFGSFEPWTGGHDVVGSYIYTGP